MGPQLIGQGRIVEGDDNGVVVNANVAIQAREQGLGQMGGLPVDEGFPQALAQLMEAGLGQEGEGHAPVADVEIMGAGLLPAEFLMVVKKFLDMPAFGKIGDEAFGAVERSRADKALVLILGGLFPGALDPLIERRQIVQARQRLLRQGQTSPLRGKGRLRQGREPLFEARLFGHGHQEVEGLVPAEPIEQFPREMFAVSQDEDFLTGLGCGAQNALGQGEQVGGGLADGAGRSAGGQADGLMAVRIQGEEGLSTFAGSVGLGGQMMEPHVPLAVAFQAMRIDGQQLAHEVAPGAADQTQGDLQLLGLLDGVSVQQLMDGRVTGNKGQTTGQFKAGLTRGAALAHPRHTQGRLMDQLERQTRPHRVSGLATPGAQQVPGAQAQVFGQQEPETGQGAVDFIGQQLADAAFEAFGIGGLELLAQQAALGLNLCGKRAGAEDVEFFFAGRTGPQPVRRSGC